MRSDISHGGRRRYVLDANALIGFFEGRRGSADKVRHLFGEALRHDELLLMPAVNWGEYFILRGDATAKRWRERSRRSCGSCRLRSSPWIGPRAVRSGTLKQKHGLGYADAFAAELAIEQGVWLVTAGPEFSKAGKGLSVFLLPRHEKQGWHATPSQLSTRSRSSVIFFSTR